MTEQEWLASADPAALLEFMNPSRPVRCLQRIIARKLWLFVDECRLRWFRDDRAWGNYDNLHAACAAYTERHQSVMPVNPLPLRAAILRDIIGNPFRRLGRFGSTAIIDCTIERLYGISQMARRIAQAIYDERRFEDIPILADALEDCGCDNEEILTHCRGLGLHVRGCWVLDLILGKE